MPEDRTVQLERELTETRNAAAEMIADTIAQLVTSDDGRETVARAFDEYGDAEDAGSVRARLARLVAAKIRDRN